MGTLIASTSQTLGPLSADVRDSLVSFLNQKEGTINNLELELVGSYLHDKVGAQDYDIQEWTTKSGANNLLTWYWNRKGPVTTTSPHHQRPQSCASKPCINATTHHYLGLKDYSSPGLNNKMADDASRLGTPGITVSSFNSTRPPPTAQSPRAGLLVDSRFGTEVQVLSKHPVKSQPPNFVSEPTKINAKVYSGRWMGAYDFEIPVVKKTSENSNHTVCPSTLDDATTDALARRSADGRGRASPAALFSLVSLGDVQ
jgi:hypothetical protein